MEEQKPKNIQSLEELHKPDLKTQQKRVYFNKRLKLISLLFFLLLALSLLIIFLVLKQQEKSSTPPQDRCNLLECEFGCSNGQCLTPQDETANWKMYSNEALGFTIRYPQGWSETQSKENEITFTERNAPNHLVDDKISVTVYENVNQLSTLEFLDTLFYKDYTGELHNSSSSLKKTYMESYTKESLLAPTTLDGKTATRIKELITPIGSAGNAIWVTYNGRGYFIMSHSSADEWREPLFNQILSTFKFIDQGAVYRDTGKIAFIRNGDLFILDKKGVKQLTTNANIAQFKWSPNREYIGFITEKNFSYGNDKIPMGISLSLINIQTEQINEIVKQKYTDESLQKQLKEGVRGLSLSGFDFSPDATKVVYVREGVRIKDINLGNEEKVADNYLTNSPVTGEFYTDADWNPTDSTILLHIGVWECVAEELYDLTTKQKKTLNLSPSCSIGHWTPDGKSILVHSTYGMYEGGLWKTDVISGKPIRLIEDPMGASGFKVPLSVWDAVVGQDGSVLAVIDPFAEDTNVLPFVGQNIYLIKSTSSFVPLTKDDLFGKNYRSNLAWSPDGSKITYLLNNTYPSSDSSNNANKLQIMDSDGNNERTLLTNVSSYAWTPK